MLLSVMTFCFNGERLNAQIVPSGGIPQVSAGSFSVIPFDDAVVNCDMIATKAYNSDIVEAIVYSRRGCAMCTSTSNQAYLYIEDWGNVPGNPNITVTLPGNPVEPDVALSYFVDGSGFTHIQAAVVWADNGDVYFQAYEIGGVGSSSLSATPVASSPYQVNISSGAAWGSPHIDMFVDPSKAITGVPTVKDYAIVWTEGVNHNLYVYYGDLDNTLTTSGGAPSYITNNVYMPDVACLTDYNASPADNRAQICYSNGTGFTGNLNLKEFSTSSGAVVSTITVASGVSVFYPRIEAMNQYFGINVKWQIVTCLQGTSVFQAVGYNNLTSGATALSSPLFSSDDVKAPSVGAAMGPTTSIFSSTDIGNIQYTAGFFPWNFTDLYARDIDASTGSLVSGSYYQVNDPSPGVNFAWDAARNFAISSTTNLGLELLTAWADGSDISFKHSPNGSNPMFFRNTPVHTITNAFSPISPNPAKDQINFEANVGSQYRITDVIGKTVLSGIADEYNSTQISALPSGMYMLQRVLGHEHETVKFTKL